MISPAIAFATLLSAFGASDFFGYASGTLGPSYTDTVDTVTFTAPANESVEFYVEAETPPNHGGGTNELEVRIQVKDGGNWDTIKTKVLNMPEDSERFTVTIPNRTSGTANESVRIRLSRKVLTNDIDWYLEVVY